VTLVDIGWSRSVTFPWELESALNERTAAVVFVATFASPACLSLEEVILIAHAAQIPVIVDAAPDLPPIENLHKFTGMGADLVIFSGGKAIQGPQSTGIIVGRPDLIEACALNSNPNHNTIGRPLKVGKEEIVGLVYALELFLQRDEQAEHLLLQQQNAYIVDRLTALDGVLDGVKVWHEPHDEYGRPVPRAYVELGTGARLSAAAAAAALRQGDPPIHVVLKGNRLVINPQMMAAGEEEVVAERLATLLQG
jgi:L-seryl-tRNA(Ser) seleniumtransferase